MLHHKNNDIYRNTIMNRLDRLSSILIQLQAKKVVKGSDLAKRYSISLRTAYRDIKTLEQAGVPIIGEAGVGYSLMDGYRLPPVMFTREEATAFLTAEKLVEKFTDQGTFALYESALDKIKAVLRSDEKEHLENMYQHIEVLRNPFDQNTSHKPDTLQILLQSIARKEPVILDYETNYAKEKSSRKVEPFGIFLRSRHWYLVAYCWLRKDYRTFRVDGITAIRNTGEAFALSHPPLHTYLQTLTRENRELQKVVIRVNTKVISYMGDQKFYNGFVSEKSLKDESEMTFLTASLEGFARWFVMFGDQARILQPAVLKERILAISVKTQKNLKK